MNNLHRFASCWLAALALAYAPACQQSHTRHSSESHFLECERDKDCAPEGEEFECRRGLCMPAPEPREAARAPSEPAQEPDEPAGAAGAQGAAGGPAVDESPAEPVDDPPSAPDAAAPVAPNPCSIETPFDADENCLPAPPAGEGIQIHIGPDDYEDPAELERWVLNPGDEVSECRFFETPNDSAISYGDWHLSGRRGIQRALITIGAGEDAGAPDACANPNAPPVDPFLLTWPTTEARAQVTPAAHAWPVAPRSPGQVHLHTFNFTDRPILRELWLNLYFPEPD
jgi:hypothetical protein